MRLKLFLIFLLTVTTACSVQQVAPGQSLDRQSRWIVLPFENHSETPMASERVQALTLAALRTRRLTVAAAHTDADPYELPRYDGRRRYNDAIATARSEGVQYGVTGSVVEWRYKSGLDGEPAVGVAMHVVDIRSGETLWSGSYSRSGWSRESLSGTGQKVISKLVDGLLSG